VGGESCATDRDTGRGELGEFTSFHAYCLMKLSKELSGERKSR
jgi:hypothetical protein